MNVHFSSKTDLWATPQVFFDELDNEFHFETDVCALPENQPPSGGCVLKQALIDAAVAAAVAQPPSGGCVLKRSKATVAHEHSGQPPSGGCVLKLEQCLYRTEYQGPAAFRRLCVET